MTATHEPTPRKRTTTSKAKTPRKTRAKAAAPALAESAVLVILESADPAPSAGAALDPAARRQLIATEAYFIAQRRGFAAGHELDDWIAAEAAVESRLGKLQAA